MVVSKTTTEIDGSTRFYFRFLHSPPFAVTNEGRFNYRELSIEL